MWGVNYCGLGDLGGTQLTVSLLETSTRLGLIRGCVLILLRDKTFHLRGRLLMMPGVLNRSETFQLAGKFAATHELNNSIALESS